MPMEYYFFNFVKYSGTHNVVICVNLLLSREFESVIGMELIRANIHIMLPSFSITPSFRLNRGENK